MGLNSYAAFPTSILSILGCSAVIVLYHKFKSTINGEEFTQGYILAWFYLVLSFITLFTQIDSSRFCTFQGIVVIISGLGGILWTGYIALYLYIKCYRDNIVYKTPFCKVLLVIFIICAISAAFPAAFGDIKSGGGLWCWIVNENNEYRDIIFIYLLYYSFVWSIIIWNVYSFCLVARVVSRSNSTSQGTDIARRLKWYSMILLVFYIPQTIYRIWQSAGDPSVSLSNFGYFSGVWIRLLGLANSIAYGMIPEVKEKIRALFQS